MSALCNFQLGFEPVLKVVTVFAAAFLVKMKSANTYIFNRDANPRSRCLRFRRGRAKYSFILFRMLLNFSDDHDLTVHI
jgi:hypothetical protein